MERVLGVAIGIAVVCLLLSILASHVQEVWATWSGRRAGSLEAAIRGMLGAAIAKRFFAHPLIETISFSVPKQWANFLPGGPKPEGKPQEARPTYVASPIFARVLYCALVQEYNLKGKTLPEAIHELPAVIAKLPPREAEEANKLKERLTTLLHGVGDDAVLATRAVEQWYDGTMDRINGFYKRNTQGVLLFLGLVLAVVCNANLFSITEKLWSSDDARTALTATAEMYSCKPGEPCRSGDWTQARSEMSSELSDYIPVGYHKTGAYWDYVGDLVFHGDTWQKENQGKERGAAFRAVLVGWLLNLAGWGLTGVAVSLGAPFWFDTVNKLVNIRLAGAKPERAPMPYDPNKSKDGGGDVLNVVAPQMNAPVVAITNNEPLPPGDDGGQAAAALVSAPPLAPTPDDSASDAPASDSVTPDSGEAVVPQPEEAADAPGPQAAAGAEAASGGEAAQRLHSLRGAGAGRPGMHSRVRR